MASEVHRLGAFPAAVHIDERLSVVVVEGLSPSGGEGEVSALNQALVSALSARLFLVASAQGKTVDQLCESAMQAIRNLIWQGQFNKISGASD